MTDGMRDYLSRERGRELADLRWHWDEAYEITWDGKFRAKRLDDGGFIHLIAHDSGAPPP